MGEKIEALAAGSIALALGEERSTTDRGLEDKRGTH